MSFADVTALLRTWLIAQGLAPVVGRVPDRRPAEFIHLRRVGGSAVAPVREIARLDVFAWAETDPRAHELGQAVRAAIWALSGTTELGLQVYTVEEFKTMTAIDDPDTGTPRTWATYDLMIRADRLVNPSPTVGA